MISFFPRGSINFYGCSKGEGFMLKCFGLEQLGRRSISKVNAL